MASKDTKKKLPKQIANDDIFHIYSKKNVRHIFGFIGDYVYKGKIVIKCDEKTIDCILNKFLKNPVIEDEGLSKKITLYMDIEIGIEKLYILLNKFDMNKIDLDTWNFLNKANLETDVKYFDKKVRIDNLLYSARIEAIAGI